MAERRSGASTRMVSCKSLPFSMRLWAYRSSRKATCCRRPVAAFSANLATNVGEFRRSGQGRERGRSGRAPQKLVLGHEPAGEVVALAALQPALVRAVRDLVLGDRDLPAARRTLRLLRRALDDARHRCLLPAGELTGRRSTPRARLLPQQAREPPVLEDAAA